MNFINSLLFFVLLTDSLATNAIRNVSNTGALLCRPSEFACENYYRCVRLDMMCNGVDNCHDGSDENLLNCIQKGAQPAHLSCKENEFMCKNRLKCIPKQYICDGNNNCRDHSDEHPEECIRAGHYDDHITCGDIGFQCPDSNKTCFSKDFLCNGKNDCGDNTDEDITNCIIMGQVSEVLTCYASEFQCKNGFKCVSKLRLCDSVNDCYDGSDEDPVECIKENILPEGVTCADLGFECSNTSFGGSFCIGNLFICDGKNDCGDNSDENPEICQHRTDQPNIHLLPWYDPPAPNTFVERRCGNNQFQCDEGHCISKRSLCNSYVECGNKIDEDPATCENYTITSGCMSHQFKCPKTSKCISKSYICDGDNDCGGLEDEDPKLCHLKQSVINFQPTDMSTRHTPRPKICRKNQFKCKNGLSCVSRLFICDGDDDCDDDSDEDADVCHQKAAQSTRNSTTTTTTVATPSGCNHDEFRCNNGQCVHSLFVCDGDNDCGDYSDESPPHCNQVTSTIGARASRECPTTTGLRCLNGEGCFEAFQICDGRADCTDGSDEPAFCTAVAPTTTSTSTTSRQRGPVRCKLDEFKCADGHKCIPNAYVCDDAADCDDESDEIPSICIHPTEETVEEHHLSNGNPMCCGPNLLWFAFKIIIIAII